MQGNVWAWVFCRTIDIGVAHLLDLKQNGEPSQQGGNRSRPNAGFLHWRVSGMATQTAHGAELYRAEAWNAETLRKYEFGTPGGWLERHAHAGGIEIGDHSTSSNETAPALEHGSGRRWRCKRSPASRESFPARSPERCRCAEQCRLKASAEFSTRLRQCA
ncbi:hypothetical protein [Burkholderia sp. BE17]|uniref:hypothetical protein n=1 Tax=Burkholderia sp. BE17 TaxID=2656644 RepID=UPI00128B8932|nr:hypothetical protein [Burkholderia sp. BE17]MPV65194.1 hypothetical protein [Burkholderia sp. BE17]